MDPPAVEIGATEFDYQNARAAVLSGEYIQACREKLYVYLWAIVNAPHRQERVAERTELLRAIKQQLILANM
jgi:hypothetical protein